MSSEAWLIRKAKKGDTKARSFGKTAYFAGTNRNSERACQLVWKRLFPSGNCFYQQSRNQCRGDGSAWAWVSGVHRRSSKVLERGNACAERTLSEDHIKYGDCVEEKYSIFAGGTQIYRNDPGRMWIIVAGRNLQCG